MPTPELSAGKANYEYLKSQRESIEKRRQEERAAKAEQTKAIFEALLKGEAKETQPGETADIFAPAQAKQPANIGQSILQGLGMPPQMEQPVGYKVQPNLDRQVKEASINKANMEAKQIADFLTGGTSGGEGVSGFRPKSVDVGAINYERIPSIEDTPPKPLENDQVAAITDTKDTINTLQELQDLVKSKKVMPGMATRYSSYNPLGQAYTSLAGGQEPIAFRQKLRLLQSKFLKSQTGAARGFKEVQFLLPALPKGELSPEDFVNAAETAKQDLQKNLSNMLDVAKKSRRDVSGFEDLMTPQTSQNSLSFNSEQEAEMANLPKGTIVIINGRKARID